MAIVSELLPGNVMDFRKFCVKGITYGQACGGVMKVITAASVTFR